MTDALHQSEKLASMGSLLGGVAHELNNPLSVVIGRAPMLEAAAKDAATINGVRKLRTAAERRERIVTTFLAMARRRQPQRHTVGIHTCSRRACFRGYFGTTRISIPQEMPSKQSSIQRLARVLL